MPGGVRPGLLVTGALHDPRVLIHEPAKWVAEVLAFILDEVLAFILDEVLAFILDEAGVRGRP